MIPVGRAVMTLSIARRLATMPELTGALFVCPGPMKVCICNTGTLEMVKKVFGIQVTGALCGGHTRQCAERFANTSLLYAVCNRNGFYYEQHANVTHFQVS